MTLRPHGRLARLTNPGWPPRDRGSVTVELAMGLPAVVLVLGLVVSALVWARAGVEATQAAGFGARIAAVEGLAVAEAELDRMVPHGRSRVVMHGSYAEVHVVIDGPAWLPAMSATSAARIDR